MSIGTSFLKTYYQWERRDWIKTQRMTPHAWKLRYNRVSQGMDQIVYVSIYIICLDYFIFLWNFIHYTN